MTDKASKKADAARQKAHDAIRELVATKADMIFERLALIRVHLSMEMSQSEPTKEEITIDQIYQLIHSLRLDDRQADLERIKWIVDDAVGMLSNPVYTKDRP
jgi:hypothetical protein